jgi:hypothetical protein
MYQFTHRGGCRRSETLYNKDKKKEGGRTDGDTEGVNDSLQCPSSSPFSRTAFAVRSTNVPPFRYYLCTWLFTESITPTTAVRHHSHLHW